MEDSEDIQASIERVRQKSAKLSALIAPPYDLNTPYGYKAGIKRLLELREEFPRMDSFIYVQRGRINQKQSWKEMVLRNKRLSWKTFEQATLPEVVMSHVSGREEPIGTRDTPVHILENVGQDSSKVFSSYTCQDPIKNLAESLLAAYKASINYLFTTAFVLGESLPERCLNNELRSHFAQLEKNDEQPLLLQNAEERLLESKQVYNEVFALVREEFLPLVSDLKEMMIESKIDKVSIKEGMVWVSKETVIYKGFMGTRSKTIPLLHFKENKAAQDEGDLSRFVIEEPPLKLGRSTLMKPGDVDPMSIALLLKNYHAIIGKIENILSDKIAAIEGHQGSESAAL